MKAKGTWNTKSQKTQQLYDEQKFSYADIVVSSGEIRRLFFQRCRDLGVDPNSLAMRHGISVNAFNTHYVRTSFPQCTRTFDQEKFLKMIESIGINIRVVVALKPLDEVSVELKERGIIK